MTGEEMGTEIKTVKETRKAIRECAEVLVQPRFGNSESWVKMRKADAMDLLRGLKSNQTPNDAEMYSDMFAELMDDGVLYLG